MEHAAGCVSLVIPCLNEEESLPTCLDAVRDVATSMNEKYGLTLEVILVDDGSTDGTLDVFRRAQSQESDVLVVRWISFSRNFGKEASLLAGFSHARGDYVAAMDADMQDPPALLPKMYELLVSTGCDNVAARRSSREGESPIRSALSRRFYGVADGLSDVRFVDGERDYRLMRRPMLNALLEMVEYNRFTKGMFSWVGFTTEWISYDHVSRVAGTTKWSLRQLLRYSVDGITSFSTKPLVLAAKIGLWCCVLSIVMLVLVIVRHLAAGISIMGWSSVLCVVIFVAGLQLIFLGVIGYYLAKVYLETKHRPHYVVREQSDATE